MSTLPSPFTVRGEFDISGLQISVLSTLLEKCSVISDVTAYSTYQLEMFHWMQRALERFIKCYSLIVLDDFCLASICYQIEMHSHIVRSPSLLSHILQT